MRLARALIGIALLCAVPWRVQAQRSPQASAPSATSLPDSISRPFIPGGRWLPTMPTMPTMPAMPATGDMPAPADAFPAQLMSADGVPYFTRPNGLLLRTGASVFQLSLRRDTASIPMGIRSLVVSETMLGGVPGWLIAESRTGTAVVTTDSLYVHRSDLMPERWGATIGRSQLAVSFTPDSMFAAVQDYQGRGSFSAAIPAGALLTAGMIDKVLELLPLARDYRSAASLFLVDAGAPTVLPAELMVEREEGVALLDRLVDCWVVVLRAGSLEKRYWVSKDAPRVVKSEQGTSRGVLTAILQS